MRANSLLLRMGVPLLSFIVVIGLFIPFRYVAQIYCTQTWADTANFVHPLTIIFWPSYFLISSVIIMGAARAVHLRRATMVVVFIAGLLLLTDVIPNLELDAMLGIPYGGMSGYDRYEVSEHLNTQRISLNLCLVAYVLGTVALFVMNKSRRNG